MNKCFFLLLSFLTLAGCSSNSPANTNPYLPNFPVNVDINLNLPQYSELKFVSNAVFIPNQGARGIIIFNTSGTTYNAFDAACPNQSLSACSTMSFKKIDAQRFDQTRVVCPCDEAEYSLFSGQAVGKQYPLKQYRVEVNGNVLRVYN